MSGWVAAVGAVLSALIASVALAVALRAKEVAESANKIANQGNDLAQTANGVAEAGNALAQSANETAANALGEAEKANEIASASNRLAGDANEIAERALRVAQDDVPYKWVLCVGDDGNAVVTNDCGHHALQVTVALESGGRVIAEHAVEDFDPFGKITLDVWGVLGQHFETVRSHQLCTPIGRADWSLRGGTASPSVSLSVPICVGEPSRTFPARVWSKKSSATR